MNGIDIERAPLRAGGPWRAPAFWVAALIVSLACLAGAARLFPLAIPILNLEIRMSRAEAIDAARAQATRLGLAPADPQVATRFASDSRAQNYVELEGGGKPAWTALLAGDRYAPYTWEVRLFRPGVVDEATLHFRPDGAVDGFSRRVAEGYVRDPASKALDAATARALAEDRARKDWAVEFAQWRFLEQSQQTRPAGRVDHAFVYEQPDPVGQARIRLRLEVAGDELVEVSRSLHVPEAFERRFGEMRSANDLIARVASISALLLYGVGGCIVGVLWLLRRRWLAWRPALAAGYAVGALVAAALLANAPSAWMAFDTAQSATTFWLRQGGVALAVLLGGGLAYALVFMAAESLSRRAFPQQPQLWRLWSREAGASVQTLGRTVGGYLFVPVELAFIVAFYYVSNRWLGWWQPAESLTDPNILSSAVPALMPIALSVQAGFMEESLFRAVPLALGALIGARFGHRTAGIVCAVVLQALVFGGAHANYPGFPAYSRLVELLLPSVVWALIFLRFGLLPTILLHAAFDLVLMSLPVFLVDAPGAGWQRALVIVAGLVPLAFVAFRRMQAGRFAELAPALRNGAWAPAAAREPPPAEPASGAASHRDALFHKAVPWLGLAGLVAFAWQARIGSDAPPFALSRGDAVAVAEKALAERGAPPGPAWSRLATIQVPDATASPAHAFVWREAGPERYRALIGTVLSPPVWQVRFATFEGPVDARAEEWRASVDGRGAVRELAHTLPEARKGPRLSRDEALALARKAVRERLGVDPATLMLVGGEDQSRPDRTDWSFQWRQPDVDVGPGGEARLAVAVAGDEVVGARRFVHTPEDWLRKERDRESRLQVVRLGGALLGALVGVAALIVGIVAWSRGRSDPRASVLVGGWVLAIMLANAALAWPETLASLSTVEPPGAQIALRIAAFAAGALVLAVVAGVLAGVGSHWARRASARPPVTRWPPWLAGVAGGFAIGGAIALADRLQPSLAPVWPTFAFEATAAPLLAAALTGLRLPLAIGMVCFALAVLAQITADGRRRLALVPLLLVVVFGLQAAGAGAPIAAALAAAVLLALVAAWVVFALLLPEPRTIPAFLATVFVLGAIDSALAKATLQGAVLGAAQVTGVLVAAWLAGSYLRRPPIASPT